MRLRLRRSNVVAAVMCVSLPMLTACAGNDYGLDDGVRDLRRDAGLSKAQAECVVAGLGGEIGRDELRGFAEPTRRQGALVRGLLESCTKATGAVGPTSAG